MRYRSFFLALGTLSLGPALVGCMQADHTIDIVFDPCEPLVLIPPEDVRSEELRDLQTGLEMWNALLGAQITLEAVPGASTLPVIFQEAPLAFLGLYEDERGNIIINRRLEAPRARSITVAHELGHAMGLPHIEREVRVSVMNLANTTETPNRQDQEAIAGLWGECRAP